MSGAGPGDRPDHDGGGNQDTRAAETTARLTGSAWVFERVGGEPVPDRARVTLEFEPAEQRLFGLAACNRYTAGYAIDDDRLAVQLLASTKRACPEALMLVEARFLETLKAAPRIDFDDEGHLRLIDEQGRPSRAIAEPRGLER